MEAQGLRLLAAWRGAGRPVIHVKHNSTAPGSTLRPGQPGNDFKPGFEPLAGEALIEKTVNAAFIGTGLEAALRTRGLARIVAFGITTDMCVSTSVRLGATLCSELVVVAVAYAHFAPRARERQGGG